MVLPRYPPFATRPLRHDGCGWQTFDGGDIEYKFLGPHQDIRKTKELQDQGKKINLSLSEVLEGNDYQVPYYLQYNSLWVAVSADDTGYG